MASHDISLLIQFLSQLPGAGPKSGRRIALHLLKHRETVLKPLIDVLTRSYERIIPCQTCFMLHDHSSCSYCTDPTRDQSMICVVESVGDVWAMERTQMYKGLYHVLGGLLSGVEGITPKHLTLAPLLERIQNHTQEIILSFSPTMDGQTTLYYVMDQLKGFSNLRITTLASGIPLGAELDYIDEGTLLEAFKGRRSLRNE